MRAAVRGTVDGVGPVSPGAGYGPTLALWALLTVAAHGGLWAFGFRSVALAGAVEQGAVRVESQAGAGVGDELVRKAVRIQHETRRFWAVLTGLDDFVVEPFVPAARAAAAATAFGAIAAAQGRRVGFEAGLAGSAAAQGFWVLGLLVRAALMVGLRRDDVDTSAALLLPAGSHLAATWLALRQLDAFVLLGWWATARGACRRGQVTWPAALAVVVALGTAEAVARVAAGLILGSAVRAAVVPE